MGIMPVVILLQYLMTKKLNKIYAASTVFVLVSGRVHARFATRTFHVLETDRS